METKNCFPVDNSEMFFPSQKAALWFNFILSFFLMMGIFFDQNLSD